MFEAPTSTDIHLFGRIGPLSFLFVTYLCFFTSKLLDHWDGFFSNISYTILYSPEYYIFIVGMIISILFHLANYVLIMRMINDHFLSDFENGEDIPKFCDNDNEDRKVLSILPAPSPADQINIQIPTIAIRESRFSRQQKYRFFKILYVCEYFFGCFGMCYYALMGSVKITKNLALHAHFAFMFGMTQLFEMFVIIILFTYDIKMHSKSITLVNPKPITTWRLMIARYIICLGGATAGILYFVFQNPCNYEDRFCLHRSVCQHLCVLFICAFKFAFYFDLKRHFIVHD
eukprot:TRINITY_DN15035_c0_g1_i1.p1 TRINITY_DN15035_c0_g1~~TRINITY_DN15035_c0_g1_i1.p1  ORF type:complete len:288 (+),score=42.40 TRINITY_DN15035_c0_g1_i1:219-1082(+)